MKKIKYYLLHPSKVLICLMNKNFFFFLPDKLFLKIKFKLIMGYKLNLKNPQTFNEKLQWLKLFDRKDIYTTMVDKYEAKQYVKNVIGEEYIINTLGIYDKFDDIDFSELPNQFVLKPTHSSGNIFICKDKSKIDLKSLKKIVNKWMKRDYYKIHREWPYKNVKRRIIIEEYLSEFEDKNVNDYKFFIFNGKLAYSFICSDRNVDLKFTFFDKNGNFMNITQDSCPNNPNIKLPKTYKEMIKLSEKLGKELVEVRVDFYEIKGKIYFGELTFYDSAGFGKFDPEEWDNIIGSWLKLPRK